MLFRIFTLLAVFALAVSTWILSSPGHQPLLQNPADTPDLPGYYLKNAVLTDFDLTGKPSIRIEAERIDQIAHSSEAALYNVKVDYGTPGGHSWIMVGDEAHIQPGGKILDVSGNVRLQGEPTGRQAAPIVHTDTLSYNVTDSIASTHDDVRIDFGAHTLTAHGMVANFKERTLRLESKVNGRFHP